MYGDDLRPFPTLSDRRKKEAITSPFHEHILNWEGSNENGKKMVAGGGAQ